MLPHLQMKRLRLNEVTICLRFKSSKWGLDQVVQDLERHLEASVYSGVGTGLAEGSLQDSPSVSAVESDNVRFS